MARPTTIDNAAILEAARAVFLEHGLAATAQHVAERAGVSTGSIFSRFGTKDALFQAALSTAYMPAWASELPGRAGRGDLRVELAALAREMLAYFRQIMPTVMLGWTHARGNVPAPLEEKSAPVQALAVLNIFFAREIELGRLRKRDSKALAHIWLGALWSFVAMDVLFSVQLHVAMTEEQFLNELLDTVLETAVQPVQRRPPKGKNKPR